MKKLKLFQQKLKFNSSISSNSNCSTASSSTSTSSNISSCQKVNDHECITESEPVVEKQRMFTEQENRVGKIKMRVKKADSRSNRFSAHVSMNSSQNNNNSSSHNSALQNKRYSAVDLNTKEINYIYKVLLIGNSGVGKTSIMNRFCINSYMPNYIDTIGVDFKTKILKLVPDFVNDLNNRNSKHVALKRSSSINQNHNKFDNETLRVKLQIWDTTGAQRFQSIALNYYRGANGILLVYDVTDRKSFESVKKWMKTVSDYCTDKVEVCLVANKCDAGYNKSETIQRKVSKVEGETLAAMYGLTYIETSARTNINIEKTFTDLTKNIRKKLDFVIQQTKNEIEKEEEKIKVRHSSFKNRYLKVTSKRKISSLFTSNSFISCFVCNSRQLAENT